MAVGRGVVPDGRGAWSGAQSHRAAVSFIARLFLFFWFVFHKKRA